MADRRTHVLRFRVTACELAWARTIAAENGLPLASVIRQAFGTYVADYAETVATFPANTPTSEPPYRLG